MPQALFRGPIDSVSPWLMPVAHGLQHAEDELREVLPKVPEASLWRQPGGAASVGWHLLHIAGSTDRLVSYALGQPLNEEKRSWLELERAGSAELSKDELLQEVVRVFDQVLSILRDLDDADLQTPRQVGAAQLPSTEFGLLFHAAEHAQRHSGQIVTTLRFLASST